MATTPKPTTDLEPPAAPEVAVELTAEQLAALEAEQAEAPITVEMYASTPSERVPLAGLLAKHPELATAELSPREWSEALGDYLLKHEV